MEIKYVDGCVVFSTAPESQWNVELKLEKKITDYLSADQLQEVHEFMDGLIEKAIDNWTGKHQ